MHRSPKSTSLASGKRSPGTGCSSESSPSLSRTGIENTPGHQCLSRKPSLPEGGAVRSMSPTRMVPLPQLFQCSRKLSAPTCQKPVEPRVSRISRANGSTQAPGNGNPSQGTMVRPWRLRDPQLPPDQNCASQIKDKSARTKVGSLLANGINASLGNYPFWTRPRWGWRLSARRRLVEPHSWGTEAVGVVGEIRASCRCSTRGLWDLGGLGGLSKRRRIAMCRVSWGVPSSGSSVFFKALHGLEEGPSRSRLCFS